MRHCISLRKFSSSSCLFRPKLSSNYKSKDIWDERFNCKSLTDYESIKTINNKISGNDELDELELDTFINVAAPQTDEIAHLKEAADLLRRFRRTLRAHLMIPSTSHAVCRLFLDSEQLPSLVNLIEQRVHYGIFPDPFALNLSFDAALENDRLSLASRLAVHIMLQEDFGLNAISDTFSLFSVSKYIESKPDFDQWSSPEITSDPIFTNEDEKSAKNAPNKGDGEEEEEDQYIRVPFLRNPYYDDHFDIKNPRVLCGKTLIMLSKQFQSDHGLTQKLRLLGHVLRGRWDDSLKISEECVQSNLKAGPLKDLINYYVTNLHGVTEPSENIKTALLGDIDKLSDEGELLSDHAEGKTDQFDRFETEDINELKSNIVSWSEQREAIRKAYAEWAERQKIIEEIKRKKEELQQREEYLYFYDKLKKRTLGRLELD